ncbi:hypothetical protein [Streptomyces sp. NPDC058155]|uniref:hypothetical protein n=1 Tax=Streptomyces sp. NPDC058155 TaxID=3346359 RepID=UPI0036E66B21
MGKRTRGTAVLCAIVVLGAGGVAGCGGSGAEDDKPSADKGGNEVRRMSAALKTLKGYDTVRMNGRYMSIADIDLRADREGNCVGTLDFGDDGRTEFVHVGGERVWHRHDDAILATWRRLAEQTGPDAVARHDKAAKKVRGKYIESSPAEVEENLELRLCDLDTTFADVPDSVSGAEARNPETKAGERVVGLVQQPEGGGVSVQVPVTGSPVPLRAGFEIDGEPFELAISDPGEPVKATPPLAAETVTSAEVTGLFPENPKSTQSR